MTDDIIKQLLIAFDSIPNKGLYLWHSLLLPADANYEDLLNNALAQADQSQKNSKIKEIEISLKQLRTELLLNAETKNKVTTIRDTIISAISHELLMTQMKKKMGKQSPA